MFSSFCEKTVAKIGQYFSRNIKEIFVRSYRSGWVSITKAYSRVQGGWMGWSKCAGFEGTYFMDDP